MQNQISVIAELQRVGIVPQYKGEDVVILCPFHEDTTPSCNINTERAIFNCFACGQSGTFVDLLARILGREVREVFLELSKRYGNLAGDRTISPTQVENWHNAIWEAGALLKELYNRAIVDDDIRQYRLGYNSKEGRITIPIRNEAGHVVNVRRYLPGAPSNEKMLSTKGHGAPRLFPVEQLRFDKVLLCGGELKAIAAARRLNPHGIGAITNTAAETNWLADHSAAFQGKHVWVCLDVDAAGTAGALLRCRALARFAAWLGQPIQLPLDLAKYPKGDINDFLFHGGDLLPLLRDCPAYVPEPLGLRFDATELPESVLLGDAMSAAYTGKRVAVKAVLAAVDTQGFPIPGRVEVHCDRAQDFCGNCPVFFKSEEHNATVGFEVGREHPAVLRMVGADETVQPAAIKDAIGIPEGCTVCRFQPLEYYHAEETRVSPQLEISNRAAERVMQPAIILRRDVELNETYILTGRMHPHPRTQAATLLISEVEPAQDALSTYAPTEDELKQLCLFQPDSWEVEGIGARLSAIYSDFESNVTHIYQRQRMHLFYDLAFHSPLLFGFDGETVNGWLQVLVIGDSGQGKSEAINKIIKHYGLGEKADCKGATPAGLIGGLQQMGTKWLVSWGIIPCNDKRIVALEELKGLTPEAISKLTDMRSSGIAEMSKIERKRTHARTRIIAISNPRSFGGENIQLSSYSFGVEAIRELIGNLEDVRRFDAVCMAAEGDVDARIINRAQSERPFVEHIYNGDLCRALVLWAWTRKAEQIFFTEDATAAVLQASIELCELFSDAIPIVDRGSIRLKIARLAAALAARTFCTADLQTLCVLHTHVEYIKQTLIAEYSRRVFGYAEFTTNTRAALTLREPELIINAITSVEHKYDLVKGLLTTDKLDLHNLMDFCSFDQTDAQRLASLLVRKGGLKRDGRYYFKTPPFIDLLKRIEVDGSLDTINKAAPPHINPEF